MKNKLVLGTFNSEEFWRETSFARLPSIDDVESKNIVSVMDELLFVFCQKDNDAMITRYQPEDAFHQYLYDIGYRYQHISLCNNFLNQSNFDNTKCIFELLLKSLRQINTIKNREDILLSPYSVTEYTKTFCDKYFLKNEFSDIDVVKKVNSKKYSHCISQKLDVDIGSIQVSSPSELEINANKLLKNGPIVLKEFMGVSGNGNLLIDSEVKIKRLVKYFRKQEEKNKKVGLILEQFINNKKLDFSCQINISKDGKLTILTFQQMINKGFCFKGIKEADITLIRLIKNSNYCKIIERVGYELYKEGYHGPACIDSMLLEDNRLIPIVEINARKSMGLINFKIDSLLKSYLVKGQLMHYSFSVTNEITFEKLYHNLKKANILFLPDSRKGILPLTCTSLKLNYQKGLINNNRYKGRLYFSLVAKTKEEEDIYLRKFQQLAIEMDLSLMN